MLENGNYGIKLVIHYFTNWFVQSRRSFLYPKGRDRTGDADGGDGEREVCRRNDEGVSCVLVMVLGYFTHLLLIKRRL